MSRPVVIPVNRGGDCTFRIFVPSSAQSPSGADLTGYTIEAFEPHEALVGHVTLTITNPTGALRADKNTWQITGDIQWQNDMPSGQAMSFIPRLNQGTFQMALSKFKVSVE